MLIWLHHAVERKHILKEGKVITFVIGRVPRFASKAFKKVEKLVNKLAGCCVPHMRSDWQEIRWNVNWTWFLALNSSLWRRKLKGIRKSHEPSRRLLHSIDQIYGTNLQPPHKIYLITCSLFDTSNRTESTACNHFQFFFSWFFKEKWTKKNTKIVKLFPTHEKSIRKARNIVCRCVARRSLHSRRLHIFLSELLFFYFQTFVGRAATWASV